MNNSSGSRDEHDLSHLHRDKSLQVIMMLALTCIIIVAYVALCTLFGSRLPAIGILTAAGGLGWFFVREVKRANAEERNRQR